MAHSITRYAARVTSLPQQLASHGTARDASHGTARDGRCTTALSRSPADLVVSSLPADLVVSRPPADLVTGIA